MGDIADWYADIAIEQGEKYDISYHENSKMPDEALVNALKQDEDGESFEGIVESIRQFYKERGFLSKKQRHVLLDTLAMLDVSFS